MANVGTDDQSFELQGRSIRVDQNAYVDEFGTLAGSHMDMATAVRNAVDMLGVGLTDAVRMASTHPAAFLGLAGDVGTIAVGRRANLLLADDRLNVVETWIDGRASRDRS